MNISLVEAKEVLLEDVSEFLPQHYRFLKPIGGSSKIPLSAKQEKLVALRKCLVECNGEFSLYLQSCKEKPSGSTEEKKVQQRAGAIELRNRMPRSKSQRAGTTKESKTDNHRIRIQNPHRPPQGSSRFGKRKGTSIFFARH